MRGLVKVNAGLPELVHSVVKKPVLPKSKRVKLLIFKSAFVLIFTLGHESWIVTERALSQVQAAEVGGLRRVHGETLGDKLCSCEIHKSLYVEPLHLRYVSWTVRPICPNVPGNTWVSCCPTGKQPGCIGAGKIFPVRRQ